MIDVSNELNEMARGVPLENDLKRRIYYYKKYMEYQNKAYTAPNHEIKEQFLEVADNIINIVVSELLEKDGYTPI